MATLVGIAVGVVAGAADVRAAARDVQIRSVDFESNLIEIHNFGGASVDLSGWRFCSQDDNQIRQYTGAPGLDGTSLTPGESLFVHMDNDASGVGHIDASSLAGGFAVPFDRGPYALSIYFDPITFSNGDTMADHVQWSIDGIDNTTADFRSDEAEDGGVWTDQSLWVVTSAETGSLVLLDETGGPLHGPDDYAEPVAAPLIPVLPMAASVALYVVLASLGAWAVRRRYRPARRRARGIAML